MPEDNNPQEGTSLPAKQAMENYNVLHFDEDKLSGILTALKDNLGGQSITDRDLPRIVVPAGGMEVWAVPTSEKAEYHNTIEGVIIHTTTPRAYWEKKLDDSGRTPPDCSSADGMRGTVYGSCVVCPYNQWGSDPDGNGKACREQRLLFMLTPGNLLPTVVQVPPTSIDTIKKYAINLATKAKSQWTVVTALGLTKVAAEPFPYSRIVPNEVAEVPEELIQRVQVYRENMLPLFAQANYLPETAAQLPPGEGHNEQELEDKVADLYEGRAATTRTESGQQADADPPPDDGNPASDLPDPFGD